MYATFSTYTTHLSYARYHSPQAPRIVDYVRIRQSILQKPPARTAPSIDANLHDYLYQHQ